MLIFMYMDNVYCGYRIGFDARWQFLWSDGSWGKNVVIVGVDGRSSVDVDNKKKDILVLGEGPAQGSDDTTIAEEA